MSEATKRQRGLGRGLAALFGETAETAGDAPATATPAAAQAGGETGPRPLPIEQIHPNLTQPRRHYDEEALEALAASIRDQGVLQPILVRAHPDIQGEYQIVAGERRWRAAQRAQLTALPAVVRVLNDAQVLAVALIENLQREELTALEEAEGYKRLADEFGFHQEAIAKTVRKSRSHIANTLRLLGLPEPVKALLQEGRLSAGHARALLGAADPVGLARLAVEKGWSVREVERHAQAEPLHKTARKPAPKDSDTVALEHDLGLALGLKVAIQHEGGAGKLTLHYRSLDQLDDLMARLRQTPGM